jgi:hypothetical protein
VETLGKKAPTPQGEIILLGQFLPCGIIPPWPPVFEIWRTGFKIYPISFKGMDYETPHSRACAFGLVRRTRRRRHAPHGDAAAN